MVTATTARCLGPMATKQAQNINPIYNNITVIVTKHLYFGNICSNNNIECCSFFIFERNNNNKRNNNCSDHCIETPLCPLCPARGSLDHILLLSESFRRGKVQMASWWDTELSSRHHLQTSAPSKTSCFFAECSQTTLLIWHSWH